jgi:LPS export ABC transporter protein LptC
MRSVSSKYYISKFLKFLFLVIAILIIIFLYFKSKSKTTTTSSKEPTHTETKKPPPNYEITLDNTTFKGTNDESPYTITAQKAIKCDNDIYTLEDLSAIYFIQDNPCNIISDKGEFHQTKNMIYLNGNIKATLQDYILNTDSLELNLTTKEIIGKNKIKIDYKDSEIKANQFRIENNNIIRFEGNVKTKFNFQK